MIWVAVVLLVVGLFGCSILYALTRGECELDRIARSTDESGEKLSSLMHKAEAEGRDPRDCLETRRAVDEHTRKLEAASRALEKML